MMFMNFIRVLPDSVRKKIAIIGDCKGLNEFIDPSQVWFSSTCIVINGLY